MIGEKCLREVLREVRGWYNACKLGPAMRGDRAMKRIGVKIWGLIFTFHTSILCVGGCQPYYRQYGSNPALLPKVREHPFKLFLKAGQDILKDRR